jgi:DNA-binding transcriptional MerR regulator
VSVNHTQEIQVARGRPPGSKNEKNGSASAELKITAHDNVAKHPLTDEQLQALTDSWVGHYVSALEKKKAADADLKNVCKKAKSEGVTLADIKAYIEAGTEEGQANIKANVDRGARVARWRGFAIGHQFGLFGDDDESVPLSFTLGKEAGLKGEPATCPANRDVEEFLRGWHAGQKILLAGFKPTPTEDGSSQAFDA